MSRTRPKHCAICGCELTRKAGTYATPTVAGRSHASEHHYVPERFFGRSANRPNDQRERIFETCPWKSEGKVGVYCYECHEELLHNPVLLPDDIAKFSTLVNARGLGETTKPADRAKLAGRIQLLHEVIENGLSALLAQTKESGQEPWR